MYGPLALNELRIANGLVCKVWHNNPQPRGGYWLIQPNGAMHWMLYAEIAALPLAQPEQAAEAFPIEAAMPVGLVALHPFNPMLVEIERKRFSVTQGEVLIKYAGQRIEQYGDAIALRDGEWRGYSDEFLINVARREAIERGMAA